MELPDYCRPEKGDGGKLVAKWPDGLVWDIPSEKVDEDGGQQKGSNIVARMEHGDRKLTLKKVCHANRGQWLVLRTPKTQLIQMPPSLKEEHWEQAVAFLRKQGTSYVKKKATKDQIEEAKALWLEDKLEQAPKGKSKAKATAKSKPTPMKKDVPKQKPKAQGKSAAKRKTDDNDGDEDDNEESRKRKTGAADAHDEEAEEEEEMDESKDKGAIQTEGVHKQDKKDKKNGRKDQDDRKACKDKKDKKDKNETEDNPDEIEENNETEDNPDEGNQATKKPATASAAKRPAAAEPETAAPCALGGDDPAAGAAESGAVRAAGSPRHKPRPMDGHMLGPGMFW